MNYRANDSSRVNHPQSILGFTSRPWGLLALAWWVTLSLMAGQPEPGSTPTVRPAEVRHAAGWFTRHLYDPHQPQPFSFCYGGRPSAELLALWPGNRERAVSEKGLKQRIQTWEDPATGLLVRCVAVEYAEYPVIEWTVTLKNRGLKPTPILESLQALDVSWERSGDEEFLLHGIKGDSCTADSYEPYQLQLGPNVTKAFSPPDHSGKSCDGPLGWPYYNLQTPGGGVILAIGWPGQWASSFVRDAHRRLRIRAGQQRTHMVLHPGEEIRTPLIALLFWKGSSPVNAQNLWRRWYVKHNLPQVEGQPQPPIAQIQVEGSEANMAAVRAFLDAGIYPDLCWRDAGGAHTWYPNQTGPYQGNDAWLNTGTWEVDTSRYPQGFKPFSDWVRSKGMQFLLWFEPERVGDTNSWLARQHPEWLLPGSSHGSILNLGNPAALRWLIDHVDGLIRSQGLDWYREDMNGGGPLPAWRKNDAPDRQGITENLYVQGHLAFWDELRRRHPKLRIDSCASGGRRNDLETTRRAVPLLRSDFQFPDMKGVVEGNQGHTYGLSSWLPFQGTGCYIYTPYAVRSFYLPSFGMSGLTPENIAVQQQAYFECARIAPLMLGDYYPLTPYSLQEDQWIAWQFHRRERGDGVLQAFRRAQCDDGSRTFRLQGLVPSAHYEITNLDCPGNKVRSGRELMKQGLVVQISEKPGAAIITYRAVR